MAAVAPEVRFERYINRTDTCWLWTGWTAGTKSTYGYFRPTTGSTDPRVLAHRYAYELWVGPIPAEHQVDHLCRVPLCVNPEHLEAVTPEENMRRTRRAVCGKGLHDMSAPGVARPWQGGTICWPCRQQWERLRWERRKALARGD